MHARPGIIYFTKDRKWIENNFNTIVGAKRINDDFYYIPCVDIYVHPYDCIEIKKGDSKMNKMTPFEIEIMKSAQKATKDRFETIEASLRNVESRLSKLEAVEQIDVELCEIEEPSLSCVLIWGTTIDHPKENDLSRAGSSWNDFEDDALKTEFNAFLIWTSRHLILQVETLRKFIQGNILFKGDHVEVIPELDKVLRRRFNAFTVKRACAHKRTKGAICARIKYSIYNIPRH